MMRRALQNYGLAVGTLLLCAPILATADEGAGKTVTVKKTTKTESTVVEGEVKPDNTKVNKRDRQDSELTAEQQKNNSSDLKITQQIRKSVIADKSLSMYGHNVKIIVRDGAVTLKGPVRSEAEKRAIEGKAQEIAGAANVKNEIEIAPK